ncbi:MAG: hypothetical protein IPN34_22165 [Planctomycetes bacterium]|nr:hypothetical protein [Planctomycetota bacterium]
MELAQRNAFAILSALASDLPCLVPDEVDAELCKGRDRYPSQFELYQAAIRNGLLAVVAFELGSVEHGHFLSLRNQRTSPHRNRGEDACIALALAMADSHVYLIDHRAQRRASSLLPARVRTLSDLPGWPPSGAATS